MKKFLVYILIYPLLKFVAILPFNLTYLFSDAFYIFFYYGFRYRRKLARANLHLAFPEKTEKEIIGIERKAYRHMCDMLLEIVKPISLREALEEKRYEFLNIEVLAKHTRQNLIVIWGHYANWEWMRLSPQVEKVHDVYSLYIKISNPYIDRLMYKIRSSFGLKLIEKDAVSKALLQHFKTPPPRPIIYSFGNDQTAQPSANSYWQKFMGVKVPVFTGFEAIARKLNYPVFFLDIQKKKRGKYTVEFKLITDRSGDAPEHQITDAFLQMLEAQIRRAPEYYLWTHRRWKYKEDSPAP